MELILNNLPIVLFIVITIVVRTLQARAKSRRTEAPRIFASGLEPDDEEDTAAGPVEPEEAAALIAYAQTRGASAYAVEKARTLAPPAEDPPRFGAFSGRAATESLVPEPPQAAVSAPLEEKEQISAPAPEKQKRLNEFPARMKNLKPLQNAVVWAEILGKPKGMV
jgi:hypothetical protein